MNTKQIYTQGEGGDEPISQDLDRSRHREGGGEDKETDRNNTGTTTT